ncbi:hypothetical protein TruAng_005317 [Truncatella angustata]|nr:hypothetical protein TruAng_005317 [Truncatella angustata]
MMDRFKGGIVLESAEQQEAERLRERNRVAKRASSMSDYQWREVYNTDFIVGARQKQLENNETAPLRSKTWRKGLPERTFPQPSSVPPTAVDAAILQSYQAPGSISGPTHDGLNCRSVINNTSDEDWIQFDSSAALLEPSAILWDNLPVSTMDDHSLGVSLNSQHAMVSSSGITHTSPYQSGDSSIPSPVGASTDLVQLRNPTGANNSSMLLHIAVRDGTKGIVSSLIKAGADVNSLDASGSSPLHVAVELRRLGVLELLVKNGANINARNGAHMTPLELAVRAQDEQTVDVLLSSGAELY